MGKEKIKDKLEKLVLPGIGLIGGTVAGTMDVLTTGFPFISGYFELTALEKSQGITWKDSLVGNLSYVAGVAIPFGIKYKNEIYNFVEGVLK
jgi:hypothetical protein